MIIIKRTNNRIDFLISRRNAKLNRVMNKFELQIEREISKGGKPVKKMCKDKNLDWFAKKLPKLKLKK